MPALPDRLEPMTVELFAALSGLPNVHVYRTAHNIESDLEVIPANWPDQTTRFIQIGYGGREREDVAEVRSTTRRLLVSVVPVQLVIREDNASNRVSTLSAFERQVLDTIEQLHIDTPFEVDGRTIDWEQTAPLRVRAQGDAEQYAGSVVSVVIKFYEGVA